MNELNVTVPTVSIAYETPAEKWGQIRCKDCRYWQKFSPHYGFCKGLSQNYQPCYFETHDIDDPLLCNDEINIHTRENFGCVLGEYPQQSIGDEVV